MQQCPGYINSDTVGYNIVFSMFKESDGQSIEGVGLVVKPLDWDSGDLVSVTDPATDLSEFGKSFRV